MKKYILLIGVLTVSACSNKPTDILGVESEGEYFAVDHAAKAAIAHKNENEKLVCKRVQKTGTHFRVKRCTTEAQLKADRARAQKMLDENADYITRRQIDSKGGG